jgi:hypothetical protein
MGKRKSLRNIAYTFANTIGDIKIISYCAHLLPQAFRNSSKENCAIIIEDH